MYARVITLQVQPARLEELLPFYHECVVPAGERQPGFEGLTLLTDEKTGRALSVAFWRTKSEMCAFDRNCVARLADDFAAFLDLPPTVDMYEVRSPVEAGPRKPVLGFGETAMGVRIENPCDEELSGPFERRETWQSKGIRA